MDDTTTKQQRITVQKSHNLRGRITGYVARRGAITGTGDTPAEAKSMLDDCLDDAIERLHSGTTIRTWNNHLIVVSPDLDGFTYWIDTFRPDYSISCIKDKETALESAYSHLAQNLWSHDVADDAEFLNGLPEGVKKGVSSWIKWQRSYRRLRESGLSETDAHRQACGF